MNAVAAERVVSGAVREVAAPPSGGLDDASIIEVRSVCAPETICLGNDGRLLISRAGAPLSWSRDGDARPGEFAIFCLVEGSAVMRREGGRRDVVSAPTCVLATSPLFDGQICCLPDQPSPTMIMVKLARSAFEDALSGLRPSPGPMGCGAGEATVPFTAAIARVVADLLEHQIGASLAQVYIESKIGELACIVLSEATRSRPAPASATGGVRSRDYVRTQEARAILLREHGEPPRLEHLARRVGMNRSKLAACFKELYGQGVYTYFRSHRLERARQLLLETEMSVSQVSDAVGYESVSSFSNSFRVRFGLPPGACRSASAGRVLAGQPIVSHAATDGVLER